MYTWHEYMTPKSSTSPTGAGDIEYGDVTSWARRSLIENNSGYGWIWEACANSGNATPGGIMALSSNTGNLKVKGAITANGFKHSDSTTGTNDYILLAGGGTKAISDFASSDGYLSKTTYEWNKEFSAVGNGAISLGRYKIYDTQLTFDITTTTSNTISGKLVIAAQNGVIYKATVYGDASNTLTGYLTIYQSAITSSRSWVEVFCNFPGWSKNKVHIYGVALDSATVTNQMASVTFSNGIPSGVTSGDTKWTGTIENDIILIKGPSSSTDNAIVRYDGTDGKTLQNSSASVDDSGNIIATSFKSDGSVAAMSITNGNEMSFASSSDTMYIGYNNRLGSTNKVSKYHFGCHDGTNISKGTIYCGSVVENGTALSSKYLAGSYGSDTTKFLRNDGSWVAPPVTSIPSRLGPKTNSNNVAPDNNHTTGFAYYGGNTGTNGLPANVQDAEYITLGYDNSTWAHQLLFKFNGGGVSGSSYDGTDVYTRIYNNSAGKWSD